MFHSNNLVKLATGAILSTAFPAVMSLLAFTPVVANAFEISWIDSDVTAPAFPTQTSRTALSAGFSVHNEFRMFSSADIITGGEKNLVGDADGSGSGISTPLTANLLTWIFNDVSGKLQTVVGADTTPGVTTPGSASPGGGTGLFKSAILFSDQLGMLAPTETSAAGVQYGPATFTLTGGDSFVIHFPVIEAQWKSRHITLGSATGGIDFQCTGAIFTVVTCTAEHEIQLSEDSGGLAGQVIQFELHGSSMGQVSATPNLNDGDVIECDTTGGSNIMLVANIELFNGGSISGVEWFIDGVLAATGESTNVFMSLGNHDVEMRVSVQTGQVMEISKTVTVSITDTTKPVVDAHFINAIYGNIVTEIDSENTTFVQVVVNPADICDPAPVITSTTMTPTYNSSNGDIIRIRPQRGDIRFPMTAIELETHVVDAAGNTQQATSILNVTFQ